MTRFFALFLLSFFASQNISAQFDTGNDPLGRPYLPVIGILQADVAPGIQAKVAEQISIAFTNGLKNVGGTPPPYTVVNKDQLSKAVDMLQSGESASSLKKTSYWDDLVGAHYLLRLDINSFEMGMDEDSIYDEKKKAGPGRQTPAGTGESECSIGGCGNFQSADIQQFRCKWNHQWF
jgi:hypothetical protein